MTHEELLAEIDYYLVPTEKLTGDDKVRNSAIGFMKALRAVVKLHVPDKATPGEPIICDYCKIIYPCPEVAIVIRELG